MNLDFLIIMARDLLYNSFLTILVVYPEVEHIVASLVAI